MKAIAIVFTGDEFGDGGDFIANTLRQKNVKASFFLTGNFYRDPAFTGLIKRLKNDGHYLGSHSDRHLLYCDWYKRDSLLVTKEAFTTDLLNAYTTMSSFGTTKKNAPFFLPPYEWYNDSIAAWTKELGLQLINFTGGTLSNADYTTPDLKNYRTSDAIYQSITAYEQTYGMNGFILLLHIGTDAKRTDKMYYRLGALVDYLKQKQYHMVRVDELLK